MIGGRFWVSMVVAGLLFLAAWGISGGVGARWIEGRLIQAAERGDLAGVRSALARGANPRASRLFSRSEPMGLAAAGGHAEIVRSLLAAGVGVNETSGTGHYAPPLEIAASAGRTSVVEVLLAAGADPLLEGCHSPSALTSAAAKGNVALLRLLLRRAGRLDKRADDAVIAAVEARSPQAVRLLLDAGARPNAKDFNGVTAIDSAQALGLPAIVRMLREAGAKSPLKVRASHRS